MNRTVWAVCGCVALALSSAGPALACMNGAEHHLRGPDGSLFASEDQLIGVLKRAETALRASNYSLAASELDRLVLMGQPTERMKSRFARVSAMVTVRTVGQWPLRVPRKFNTDEDKKLVLARALKVLRKRAKDVPNDPVRQSDLGEALAKLPEHRTEARRLLERLAKADILTSPHAYDALSELRSREGDATGAEAARTRCKQLDESEHACREAPKA